MSDAGELQKMQIENRALYSAIGAHVNNHTGFYFSFIDGLYGGTIMAW